MQNCRFGRYFTNSFLTVSFFNICLFHVKFNTSLRSPGLFQSYPMIQGFSHAKVCWNLLQLHLFLACRIYIQLILNINSVDNPATQGARLYEVLYAIDSIYAFRVTTIPKFSGERMCVPSLSLEVTDTPTNDHRRTLPAYCCSLSFAK